jgi:hypothetical protein
MLLYFMLRVISSVIMLLSVGIVVAGCSETYTPLTRAIAKEELIGVWRPTPESKAFLAREKIPFSDETLKLELRANGSFDLPGIPDCWLAPFGDCHGTVLIVSGTWSTYQEKKARRVGYICLSNKVRLEFEFHFRLRTLALLFPFHSFLVMLTAIEQLSFRNDCSKAVRKGLLQTKKLET